MSDETPRPRRLADRHQVLAAARIAPRTKHPRPGFVTVTDAYVTNDLREATVFYTVLGDVRDQEGTAIALNSAKGLLRSEVGKQTGVRYTPSLEFIADAMPENARHIEELIAATKKSDEKLQKRAAGAQFAGDPDPYRVPREEGQDPS